MKSDKLNKIYFFPVFLAICFTASLIFIAVKQNLSYDFKIVFSLISILFLFESISNLTAANRNVVIDGCNLIVGMYELKPSDIIYVELKPKSFFLPERFIIKSRKIKIIVQSEEDQNEFKIYMKNLLQIKFNIINNSEQNKLFPKLTKNSFFEKLFYILIIAALFAEAIPRSNKMKYEVFFVLIVILIYAVRELIFILRNRKNYFNSEGMNIKNNFIMYNNITDIKIASTRWGKNRRKYLKICTKEIDYKIPCEYINYDYIVKEYIKTKCRFE